MSKRKNLEILIRNFGIYERPPNGIADQAYFAKTPLIRGHVDFNTGMTHGIKIEAAKALYELTHAVFLENENYRRGATFKDISDAVFNILMRYFDQPPKVDSFFITKFDEEINLWFCNSIVSIHPYIPCDIIPWPTVPFTIGPIKFSWKSDLSLLINKNDQISFLFEYMYKEMEQHGASWVAELNVDNCLPSRAYEIGDLSVDLGLAALQIIMPLQFSKQFSRLHSRRVPQQRTAVCLTNGQYSGGSYIQQSALALHGSYFSQLLAHDIHLLNSLGKRIDAFLNGNTLYPKLNQSWNDAAYWFHEGLAEPLDTIAVPKLETSIEVLLHAASSKGSEARMIKAIETFHGKRSDQVLDSETKLTVKDFAKGLVRDRSRLIHGTWPTLTTDMRNSRSSLAALSQGLLKKFSLKLDKYESAATIMTDDMDAFLNWAEMH